jgi:predicted DCC family thiol-disulfide oxidoreductase YuxK
MEDVRKVLDTHQVVLFDGVCNLCDNAVTFIIKHDKNDVFRFCPLQNPEADELLQGRELNKDDVDSIILVTKDDVFVKAPAALRIAKKLDKGWPLLYSFRIVPRFLSNGVYDFVARNRYGWFGKKDNCMIPTPELKSKFIGKYHDS